MGSCISLVFTARFFALCCTLGYSHFPEQTQRKRQELHDKAPTLLTCICISFFSSFSAPSLSLPVCMSFVSSIQYTEMSSLLSEIVWAVLPSLWTVGFHCDILCDMVLPSTNSIGVRDTASTRLHSNNYNVAWRLCHFSWVCQPSLASENCPVGSPSEILLKLQGFCICSSGHKEHIASNALVLHAKRCLQAVLENAVGSVAEDALWFVPCYFMRSRSSISK